MTELIADEDSLMPTVEAINEEALTELQVQRLRPIHQRFCHLYLSGSYKIGEIASLLNVSSFTVRSWLNRSDVTSAIAEFQDQEDAIVKQGLKALRIRALNKMGDLVDSNVDGIAWQAAKDILDRTGYKPKVVSESNINVTFEQQMKELMQEIKTVDYVDVTE